MVLVLTYDLGGENCYGHVCTVGIGTSEPAATTPCQWGLVQFNITVLLEKLRCNWTYLHHSTHEITWHICWGFNDNKYNKFN